MAEVLPHFEAGPKTYTVGATAVVGGQLVELSGNRLVIPAGALSTKCVGRAMHDAAIGALVTVYDDGTHDLTAVGAITAGDHVVCGAAGTVSTIGANTFPTDVGIALESIANAAQGPVTLRLG